MKQLTLLSLIAALSSVAFAQTEPEIHFERVSIPTDGSVTNFSLPKFQPKGRHLYKVETNVYFDSTFALTMTAPAGTYNYQVVGGSQYTIARLGEFEATIASSQRTLTSTGEPVTENFPAVNFGNTHTFTEKKDIAKFLGKGTFDIEASASFDTLIDPAVSWSFADVPLAGRLGTNIVVVVRYYYTTKK